MKREFLDLGKQPIANKFLKEDEIKKVCEEVEQLEKLNGL